ncbi:hypothetical protein [Neobacillus endophyticus]|nr:hypothetical protein [Neobacillus endophyticus]
MSEIWQRRKIKVPTKPLQTATDETKKDSWCIKIPLSPKNPI